ncbi:MAG: DUF3592 domain-containing protein [Micrococcales bacterium]|nr:DUF3592 domain-containing protein [Micrococcales bacterium]
MSTIDPAEVRRHGAGAQAQQRRTNPAVGLLALVASAAGCLVSGYFVGRSFAGTFAVFRWMVANGINELSADPPYWWGFLVGIPGLAAVPAYAAASRRFTGGAVLPVSGLTLCFAAMTWGVWVQGVQWDGSNATIIYRSGGPSQNWFLDHADVWLPALFAVITVTVLGRGIWSFVQRGAKTRRTHSLLDTAMRVPGTVAEARPTGVEVNGCPVMEVTVRFVDHTGTSRRVTKRATFAPAAIPGPGTPATVLYDPADTGEGTTIVALQPLGVVEQVLRGDGGAVPLAGSGIIDPAWGPPPGSSGSNVAPPWGVHDAGPDQGWR